MPIVFSAMANPPASNRTQAKSFDSRTIGEKDVRRSVAAASSAMAMRRRQMTWSATGSSTNDMLRFFVACPRAILRKGPDSRLNLFISRDLDYRRD
jgi:hypothetical protein